MMMKFSMPMSLSFGTLVGSLLVTISLVTLLTPSVTEARSVALPSPQCHPSIVQSMPPRIRKICEALSTIWEYSDAMEEYLDEKALEEELLDSKMNEVKSGNDRRNLQYPGVKRKGEDVDHVFLRFGKRG